MSALPKTLAVTPLRLSPKPRRSRMRSQVAAHGDTVGPAIRSTDEFSMEDQENTLWCWAAVTASLARYYELSGWTQCRVVKEVLKTDQDCCADPVPSGCNTPGYLGPALRHIDYVESGFGGRASPKEIEAAIDAGQPVAVEIAWADGGAHYVIIQNRSSDGSMLLVADSLYGTSIRSRGLFPIRYREVGVWLNTYLTRPPNDGKAS